MAAATHFSHVTGTTTGDFPAFIEASVAVAAPSWRDEARRMAANGVQFLVDRYGEKARASFTPVRYRVVDFSPTRARVAVWGVTLASGSNVQGIDESWVTANLELTWIDSTWRVAGGSPTTGPTPRLLQSGTPAPAAELSEFKDYTGVPEP